MTTDIRFDPFRLWDSDDPYPVFARFRQGQGYSRGVPPYPQIDEAIYLFTAALNQRALKHPDLLQAPPGAYGEIREAMVQNSAFAVLSQSVLLADPPRHGHLRRPLAGLFSRRTVAHLEIWLQTLADDLFAKALRRGTFDITRDFATPFAIGALARVTGLPIEDPARLKHLTARLGRELEIRSHDTNEDAESACDALRAMVEHGLRNRVRGDRPTLIDVMSDLVSAGDWSHDDLISACVLMLFAGQETVIDTIGSTAVVLHRTPTQKRLLGARPDLLGSAVEELVRFAPPVHFAGARIAARDTRLGTLRLRAGDAVVPVLAAGNRDPAVVDDPDRLDIAREPAGHLAFGVGLHVCLGIHLARLELKVALRTLYRNHPGWTLADTPPTARRGILFRGYTSVPAIAI